MSTTIFVDEREKPGDAGRGGAEPAELVCENWKR